MPINIQRFSDYRPPDSITSIGNVSVAKDYQSPYPFSSWLNSFRQFNETPEIYIDLYRQYLAEWYKIKSDVILTNEQVIIISYISIFYDLKLTYFTQDERRFLTTLDYNKKQDIDIAIPFFARKLKSICQELINLRESVKAQPVKLNLGGTKKTLAKIIFDTIYTYSTATDLQADFYKSNINGTDILNNTIVLIDDLYDDTDYYNLSAYSETVPIESDLFLDFAQAILNDINQVQFIIPELSNYLTFTPANNSTDLYKLYDKDFINTINNSLSSNLNIDNIKKLTEQFAGSNYYYLSTNSLSEVVSGALFATNSDSANEQNIFNIKFALKQDPKNLYGAKDVGGFYLPQRIGLLFYNPIKSSFVIDKQKLQPNTVAIFPDPAVYPYNADGVIAFIYNTTVIKHTLSDQYIFGDIKNDEKLPDFKGFQSENASLENDTNNISKPSDSVSFFKNANNNIWLNPDIYDKTNKSTFPVSNRQTKLLIDNKRDIIKFKTDIFGNSYGLVKEVYKIENISNKYETTFLCNYFDGFFLNWPRDAGNDANNYSTFYTLTAPQIIDYIRSGVVATTVDQISAVDLNLFDNQSVIPKFVLSGDYYYIYGGSFVDLHCNIVDQPIYKGNVIYDGYTYANEYNGGLFYEFPSSDSPLWPGTVANSFQLYYQYLVDGGMNDQGGRPTFTKIAKFKPNALSATSWTINDSDQILDNGSFMYYTLSGGVYTNYDPFAPVANNFYESNIPYYNNNLSSNNTQYSTIEGLSSNKDIYSKRSTINGDIYVRTGNNTIIDSLSSALSANFNRFSSLVKNEINNNIIDFDIIYDTLIIETDNYRVVERINYDFNSGVFTGSFSPVIYMSRGVSDKSIEKFGDFWYNEKYKNILFFDTALSPTVSGTLKIIYPKVYKFELDNYNFKQIYPQSNENLVQFSLSNYLSSFYVAGLFDQYSYIFNPQNSDRPIVSYNETIDTYTVITKIYDNSGAYCIQELQFKFIGGLFTLLANNAYFANQLIRDESYTNSITSTFLDYITPAAGLSTGVWDYNAGLYKF